jgi:trans-2,3-dihydro-3-hydroxyanthranilate isomerase
MPLPFVTVDVFTERRFSGNQLAVFTDAGALDPDTMQAIAREMALSETTFVVGQGRSGPRVRIFTPELELPFAGHPSLGTAAVVGSFAPGRVALELGVGEVPVEMTRAGSTLRCELTAPEARAVPLKVDPLELCRAVGVRQRDLVPDLPVAVWSCAEGFALVPVLHGDLVTAAHPMFQPAPGDWPLGIVVFALGANRQVHARVFSPGSVTPEDAATGSANAPLAAYLHHHKKVAVGELLVTRQGVEMGRPSRLEARLVKDPDGILRARVAGGVVLVSRGEMEV